MTPFGGTVVGVELRPDALRAVRLTGWPRRRVRVAEARWQPDDAGAAAAAVEALRVALGGGRAGRVGISVDLSLLFTKRVRVPPVPAAEKRRILSLEPERFFPVRGDEEVVVSTRDADGLVFAAREREVSAWAAALEALGPIELLESGPESLARALSHGGVREASIVLDRAQDGVCVVEIAAGRVQSARRIRRDAEEAATAVASARPLPDVRSVPSDYVAAFGAAIGAGTVADGALMPPDVARRATGRRRRSLATAAGVLALALVFAVASADAARTRIEQRLDGRIDALRARAGAVSVLQQEAASLGRQAAAVASLEAARPDVLEALRLITAQLPRDAHVRSLRWSGGADWQVEGRAANAARLVPLFEEHPRFEGVRFLEATSRVTTPRGETHESFALALRLVPAP